MCSNTRGPATTPSFVTCPTIKIAIPKVFANIIRTLVDSLTWDTLPGAADTFSWYIVWMESITTISGLLSLTTCSISSRLVSHNSFKLSPNSPIRLARILICFSDSSPEIYKTWCPVFARFWQTWSKIVDFPIPGSPPTNIRAPVTIPPPNTRSNSVIPVLILSSSLNSISFKVTGRVFSLATCEALPPFFFGDNSSTKVFHSLQPGHCPNHFDDSCPQFWQKNTIPFAMISLSFHINVKRAPFTQSSF